MPDHPPKGDGDMIGSMSQRERRILFHTCFGHFLSHFNMLAFPAVVLPLTKTLSMDMAGVFSLSFWMYLLFGVMALPWGLLADRMGARHIFTVFYLGAGACGAAAAMSMDNPLGLTLSLAGIGLFSAIYHPVGLGIISKEIRQIGLGMGFNGMFGNLGLAAAPFVVGLCNWQWGPQSAYWLLGGLNLAGGLFVLRYPFVLSEAGPEQSRQGSGHLKGFLILLVAMTLGGIVYRGGSVILPATFELRNQELVSWLSSLNASDISANLVATTTASLIYLVGMAGQYVGGHLAQRYDIRKTYLLFHAMTIPLAVLAGMVTDLPLILVTMGYFFFLLGMQPSENTLVARLTPSRLHHSAFGFKFILTFGVGALSVKMVAAIQSQMGIAAVFPSLAAVSVLLVGAIVTLITQTRPQSAVASG